MYKTVEDKIFLFRREKCPSLRNTNTSVTNCAIKGSFIVNLTVETRTGVLLEMNAFISRQTNVVKITYMVNYLC